MKLKACLYSLAASVLLSGGLAAQGAAQTSAEVASLDKDAPQRILFVGNSYLYYGDSLHNDVVRMARAAYPDDKFTYKSATISGAYLAHHNIESHLEPGRLGVKEPFDVVVLQAHSTATTTPEKLEAFKASVAQMAKALEGAGAQTALYMTPAYTKIHKKFDAGMIDAIDTGYTDAGNAAGALVIPVGLAFEEAYARRPDIVLHKEYDGSHPTLLGTYLGAATVYAALYGKSAVGNSYTYYGEVSDEDAAFLQQVAEDTVAKYHSR